MLSPNLAIIKFGKKSIESQQLCRLLAKSRRSIRRIGQHWDYGLSVAFADKCTSRAQELYAMRDVTQAWKSDARPRMSQPVPPKSSARTLRRCPRLRIQDLKPTSNDPRVQI
ncbi:hypothetical protein NW759_004721 [Fusarium solani]|nr:hypothetical protein NW759_004721 [Fusarium solani]